MTLRPADADTTTFPDPVYARTVLAPIYENAKGVFGEPLMRINRAHCVMLAETRVLPHAEAARIAEALRGIETVLSSNSAPKTADLGGTAKTADLVQAIADAIARG